MNISDLIVKMEETRLALGQSREQAAGAMCVSLSSYIAWVAGRTKPRGLSVQAIEEYVAQADQ